MKKLLLLFIALQLNNSVFAQKAQERLDSLFTVLQRKNSFNGNVLIVDNGKIILEKSYGLENIKENIKLYNGS